MEKITSILEVWKPVVGYGGYYEVSSIGRVRSVKCSILKKNDIMYNKAQKIRSYFISKTGYPQITLSLNGKLRQHFIHRLVCEAFIPNPDKKLSVNHRNFIKTDNRIENLEWLTNEENSLHFHAANPGWATRLINRSRMDHPNNKPILQYSKDGAIKGRFNSISQAARLLGFNSSNISACALGKVKFYKGYGWRYTK